MNLEDYFISRFNNVSIGDDGACIENFVYSKDAFFENVHFKTEWMSYYQIAKKAMFVNISDAIAMNAKPMYALLAVAMPKTITKHQMSELVRGFEDIAKKYSVEIIGGDTIANTKLDITVTIISKTNKPLYRKGVRKNDVFAYTGELGKSKKDLTKLLRGGKINEKSKFIDIKLRDKFISQNMRFLNAGMDISDGLFTDLDKMMHVNNIGIKFYKNIDKKIGCSGEEYEMLISFDKRHKKAMIRRSKLSRTKLTIFAKVKRVKNIFKCKANHF
ncbi:thiamine-phosphate kinase [Sulfurimonas lithotrophica]|uniref:Thiamine-monophosphate kinase n=1 Tax=Sulfurimonas lithotrophica TaxID=2590022 RepID=A0A5P8P0H9_9BACT|nr:thiamine-phosphate kinase [Sulfurimonas lithotrophica]QFR49226.1 thiamine-phosphate kinase [Sulfurimonas lithotrophica]